MSWVEKNKKNARQSNNTIHWICLPKTVHILTGDLATKGPILHIKIDLNFEYIYKYIESVNWKNINGPCVYAAVRIRDTDLKNLQIISYIYFYVASIVRRAAIFWKWAAGHYVITKNRMKWSRLAMMKLLRR